MATDNSPVVTEEKLLYFYNTYLKPYINAESGGHAIKNENDLLPLEQRETMVLNTPLMGSDDSTNEATVLDVDTNVDLSVIHAPGMAGNVEGHIYSTEEHVVGKWINSKPIYEKTVVLSKSNLQSGQTNYNHNIANIEYLTLNDTMSFLHETSYNETWQLGSHNNTSTYAFHLVFISTTSIGIYISDSLFSRLNTTSNDVVVLTLQYTKTTDTV